MKRPFFICGSWLMVLLILFACSTDEKGLAPYGDHHRGVFPDEGHHNLVVNSSFEIGGHPTYQGWSGPPSLIALSQEAPPNGGNWSLQVTAGWYPEEGYAQTFISGQSGEHVYKLTVWMKCLHEWVGSFSLGLWRQGSVSQLKKVYSDCPEWIALSLTSNLAVEPTDMIRVRLSAGGASSPPAAVLFDRVELEIIE